MIQSTRISNFTAVVTSATEVTLSWSYLQSLSNEGFYIYKSDSESALLEVVFNDEIRIGNLAIGDYPTSPVSYVVSVPNTDLCTYWKVGLYDADASVNEIFTPILQTGSVSIVPVAITDLAAVKGNNDLIVQWKSQNVIGDFIVEGSNDGVNYSQVALVSDPGNTSFSAYASNGASFTDVKVSYVKPGVNTPINTVYTCPVAQQITVLDAETLSHDKINLHLKH